MSLIIMNNRTVESSTPSSEKIKKIFQEMMHASTTTEIFDLYLNLLLDREDKLNADCKKNYFITGGNKDIWTNFKKS